MDHVKKQQVVVEEVHADMDEDNGYHSNESLEFKIDENNIDNPEFHVILLLVDLCRSKTRIKYVIKFV